VDIKVFCNGDLTETPLCAVVDNGRAYTSLRTSGSRHAGLRRLRLSDDLARQVLGAERRTCPHVGQQPRTGYYTKGYFADHVAARGYITTIKLRCRTCGYRAEIRSGQPLAHPKTSYLASAKSGLPFTHADWDTSLQGLTVSRTPGNLILWVIPPRARNIRSAGPHGFGGATDAAAAFPHANPIFENEWLILLRESAPIVEP